MQQQVRYPFGGCRTCFRMPGMGIPSPTGGYAGVIVLLFRSGLIVGTVFLKKFLCTYFNGVKPKTRCMDFWKSVKFAV